MTHSVGARFHKADLHTHTPASTDYADKSAMPADLIAAAEAGGVTLLGVTDHNSADWIDAMRAAAAGSTVTIIPGVEITSPEGHILALFDTHTAAQTLSDLLIEIGIPRAHHGKEEALSKQHVEEVVRSIHKAGGLAIAAHANEKGSGLLQVKGQYKMRVVPMPELSALELIQKEDIERFCAGKVSSDYPPKACIHSSDSHALNQIARRVTYLQMDERNVNGIRQALLDYELRVRFPWNYTEPSHPHVLSLTVDQGFFGGQVFEFHEGLNCLVGGKGTGKSTTIEMLRYCFADTTDFAHIQEDHLGKIASLVGDGGTIAVVYRDTDGEQKTISREVQPWDTERQVTDSAGNPTSIVTAPAFFSQGELVEIARNTIAQLDLIDRQIDLSSHNASEVTVIGNLQANAAHLASTTSKIDALRNAIDNPETGLAAIRAQHDTLAKQLGDPLLKEFPRWETEQAHLTALEGALHAMTLAFHDAVASVDVTAIDGTLPAGAPNEKELGSLESLQREATAALERARTVFDEDTAKLHTKIQSTRRALAQLFASKKGAHDALLAGLQQASARKANAHFKSLGTRLEALTKNQRDLAALSATLNGLQAARQKLVLDFDRLRATRAAKRAAKAAEYQSKLGGFIRVSVTPGGDHRHFADAIRRLSHGATIRDTDVARISAAITPSTLLRLVLAGDIAGLVASTGVTDNVAKRLIDGLMSKGLAALLALDCVDLPDLPRVEYHVGADKYRPLTELSTGQKGTVILELAMIEGTGPLIIDHPEEPLDTKSIHDQVVTALRKGKDSRQYIFTTHNPNIAVGADAELSHVLSATADKGRIESSGGIDRQATNALLLLHLEGGPGALRRRMTKYGMQ